MEQMFYVKRDEIDSHGCSKAMKKLQTPLDQSTSLA